jgi:nucleotide sugar dehydrogenase
MLSTQGNTERLAVVGLGYVGLPLAILAAEKGYVTTGIDSNEAKLKLLESGTSYIDDITDEMIAGTTVSFTADPATIKDATVVILCVPTPVTEDKMPDLRPLEGALAMAAPFIQPGTLVVVESTINPGVCDDVLIPKLQELTGLTVGEELDVVHCPERINPGDPKWNVRNISRVIGGSTQRALDRGVALYNTLIDAEIKPMASIKEAEAVKVVENSFRDINIAFVNELAMAFHKLDINLNNVIDGAATKPFSFMPHYPGCGVGGHCIPVDPYYLIEYSRGFGFDHKFLSLARSINEGMPQFTVDLLEGTLPTGRTLEGYKVALLGLSYKANVGDDRESPAYQIRRILQEAGVDLQTFDPYIKTSTAVSLDEALAHADAVVIATGHNEFKELSAESLKRHGVVTVVDGRNVLAASRQQLLDQGINYIGIGRSPASA